ncbi:MAG: hypothetical protein ACI4U2_00955 [Christensenellaceae bacterium]
MNPIKQKLIRIRFPPVVVVAILCILLLVILLLGTSPAAQSAGGTEQKLEKVIGKIDGVGDLTVFVNEGDGGIVGVVIVCEGADRLSVRLEIMRAVSTALGVPQQIVQVCAMK